MSVNPSSLKDYLKTHFLGSQSLHPPPTIPALAGGEGVLLRADRPACRLGRYENPRRPHPLLHVSMLTERHSSSPTSVRLTNQLTLWESISSPWPARPRWTSTTVSVLGCAEGQSPNRFQSFVFPSACNTTLRFVLYIRPCLCLPIPQSRAGWVENEPLRIING